MAPATIIRVLFVPLRPPIIVARPRDWTRVATSALLLGLLAMLLVIDLLVVLPQSWVAVALGRPWIVRAALSLLSLWVVHWLAAFAYARLPRASYLLGSALVFPEQVGRRRVLLSDVEAIVVEPRPAPVYEAFVLVMADGTSHQLCATDQPGAAALYAVAARRVSRHKRRRARRAAKPQTKTR